MNVPNLGSRAKPLIITRCTHAAMSLHRGATSSSPSSSVGIASARTLSQATITTTSSTSAPSPSITGHSTAPPPPPHAPSPSSMSSSAHAAHPPQAQQPTDPNVTAAASRTVAADAAKGGANADGGGGNGGGENLSRVSTWVWRTIYLTAAAAGTGLAAQYAYDPTPIRQVGQSLYDGMNSRMRFLTEPSREKLLPDVRPGAYGAMGTPRTLVIELENTLVYSSYSRATGWRVAKRPGAEAFLAYLASFYELVVFTGNMNSYADPILNKLDPNGYVQYRLYRPETTMQNGVHVKDISGLNRPLDRVVVIDKDEECVANQRENAIVVPEWKGDPSDTTLLDLIPLLEGIVREDVRDVRDVLRDIAGKPVSEAVTAYRAGAAARAEQAAYARPASLFGHAPAEVVAAQQDSADSGAAVQAQENPTSQEDSKDEGDGDAQQQENSSSLWGALPGRTKLFNTKGISQTDATK